MRGLYITGGVLVCLLGVVAFSTAIEICGCGDKQKYKEDPLPRMLAEAAKFRRVTQYDCVLLQRKDWWAQKMLGFSFLRNLVGLNIQPRGLRTAVKIEMQNSSIAMDEKIASYLRIFNGLKGVSILLACWGGTFFFSWYSILANPQDVDNMLKSETFSVVSGTVFVFAVFLFCSGFLQTHSLL